MGYFAVIKPRDQWIEQARTAMRKLTELAGEALPLRELQPYDPEAFALLVQALHALGQPISRELIELAGLRDINQEI
jgi:hypothetical protein